MRVPANHLDMAVDLLITAATSATDDAGLKLGAFNADENQARALVLHAVTMLRGAPFAPATAADTVALSGFGGFR